MKNRVKLHYFDISCETCISSEENVCDRFIKDPFCKDSTKKFSVWLLILIHSPEPTSLQLHSLQSVELNNKKATSLKGEQDWAPVSF